MTTTTISTTTTSTFQFSANGAGLVVTDTGAIVTASGKAVEGTKTGLSLGNAGLIDATTNVGVYFKDSAVIGNTGTIYGFKAGVELAAGGTISNSGQVFAGQANLGKAGYDGINLTGAMGLSGTGTISGGAGYAYVYKQQTGYYSGTGGVGIALAADAVLVNGASGTGGNTISGGIGGTGGSNYHGGYGGAGVNLATGATVVNFGSIAGGIGGYSSYAGSNYTGGAGAELAATSSLNNAGKISGGEGYTAGFGVLAVSGAKVINSGLILGGEGAASGAGTFFAAQSGADGVYLQSSALLNNEGVIIGGVGGAGLAGKGAAGAGGYGVAADTGAIIDNTGLIEGGVGGGAATVGLGGAGGYGVQLIGGGILDNFGTVIGGVGGANGTASGGVLIGTGGGSVYDAGTIKTGGVGGVAVGFAANMTGTLTLAPTAVFEGAVAASEGAGDVLALVGTSTLSGFGSEFTGFDTLSFGAGADWRVAGSTAAFNSLSVDGFSPADKLDVTDLAFVANEALGLSGSVLDVVQGGASVDISFTGVTPGDFFTVTADGSGGVLIEEVTCYARGTRILTVDGARAVEELAAGDLLPTLHGGVLPVRWIGQRRYVAPFCNHKKVLPVRIAAGALGQGVPVRDLVVSPGHAICVDGALVHASRLVNGVSITQAARAEEVEYFHIELASHEVIFAEGAAAETFMGEYFRPQFQNAGTYAGPGAPEVSCLAVLEDGVALARVQRRLRARAGIAARPGRLRGYVEEVEGVCAGWAVDGSAEAVTVDVLADGVRVARVAANRFRADVRDAGMGDGACGFEVALPAGARNVHVVRACDGCEVERAARKAA